MGLIEAYNDVDKLLYNYCQKNGGYFLGDAMNENYPNSLLVLDQEIRPIVLGSVTVAGGRFGSRSKFVGRMQAELAYPFELSILPMNVLRMGIKMIDSEESNVKIPDLDKKYLIRGNAPDFIKMFLPDSGMADLLAAQKHIGVKIIPVDEESRIHTIEVFCSKSSSDNDLFSGPLKESDIENVADLCRETYQAITRYSMPEEEFPDYVR